MLEKELEDYFQQTAQKVEVDCANSYKNLADSAGTGICFIRSSRSSMKRYGDHLPGEG